MPPATNIAQSTNISTNTNTTIPHESQDTPAATAMARTAAVKSRQLRSYRHLLLLRGGNSGGSAAGGNTSLSGSRIGTTTSRRRRAKARKPSSARISNRATITSSTVTTTTTNTTTATTTTATSAPCVEQQQQLSSAASASSSSTATGMTTSPSKIKNRVNQHQQQLNSPVTFVTSPKKESLEATPKRAVGVSEKASIEQSKDCIPSPPVEKMFFDNRIKRKNVLALNEKVAAIREYQKTPVYKRVGRLFHCSPDQIKRIVQQKDAILSAWEQRTRRCQDAKTLQMKVVRVSMLGKAVYDWIRRMIYYQDIKISDALIQKKALQFKSAMGLQNFFPHQEWCDKFRQTYNLIQEDSRLLNIGYTQGYSVQIKDVMKDVLSECTPDNVQQGHSVDSEMENLDDDGGEDIMEADDDDNHYQKINLSGNSKDNKDENSNECRRREYIIDSKTKNDKELTKETAPRIKVLPFASSEASSDTRNHISFPTMPGLQPIRHMVALPLQARPSNSGLPQKVLVATPIMPANGQTRHCGASPITMTIIPLATIAQSTSGLPAPPSSTTTFSDHPTVAASCNNDESSIKKEIKSEPMNATDDEASGVEMQIKHEILSDDELQNEDEVPPRATQASETIRKPVDRTAAGRITVISPSILRAPGTTSNIVDKPIAREQMTLSNIRRLVQIPAREDPRTKLIETALLESSTLKTPSSYAVPTSTPSPPPATTAPSHTETKGINDFMTRMPTLTRAPTAMLPTSATPTTLNRSAVQNLKFNADVSAAAAATQLPPIQCITEARKYLKLLEDFALQKENIRLISLITRADEVLRDLDGDEDVDID